MEIGHSRLLKYFVPNTDTLKMEDNSPQVEGEVPGTQQMRGAQNNGSTSTSKNEKPLIISSYTEVFPEGAGKVRRHNQVYGDEKVENEAKQLEEKPKTKIPVSRLRQTIEKVKEERKKVKKEKRNSLTEKEKPARRSSIPKLIKTKDDKKQPKTEQPKSPDDEFDKLYQEVVKTDEIEVKNDDKDVETEFDSLIQDYEENKIQPIDVEKIKKSKIPFLTRRSLQDGESGNEADRRNKIIAARDKVRLRKSISRDEIQIDEKFVKDLKENKINIKDISNDSEKSIEKTKKERKVVEKTVQKEVTGNITDDTKAKASKTTKVTKQETVINVITEKTVKNTETSAVEGTKTEKKSKKKSSKKNKNKSKQNNNEIGTETSKVDTQKHSTEKITEKTIEIEEKDAKIEENVEASETLVKVTENNEKENTTEHNIVMSDIELSHKDTKIIESVQQSISMETEHNIIISDTELTHKDTQITESAEQSISLEETVDNIETVTSSVETIDTASTEKVTITTNVIEITNEYEAKEEIRVESEIKNMTQENNIEKSNMAAIDTIALNDEDKSIELERKLPYEKDIIKIDTAFDTTKIENRISAQELRRNEILGRSLPENNEIQSKPEIKNNIPQKTEKITYHFEHNTNRTKNITKEDFSVNKILNEQKETEDTFIHKKERETAIKLITVKSETKHINIDSKFESNVKLELSNIDVNPNKKEMKDAPKPVLDKDSSIDDVSLKWNVGKLATEENIEDGMNEKVFNEVPKKNSILSKIALFEKQDSNTFEIKTKIPKTNKLPKIQTKTNDNRVHIHTPLIVDEVFKPFATSDEGKIEELKDENPVAAINEEVLTKEFTEDNEHRINENVSSEIDVKINGDRDEIPLTIEDVKIADFDKDNSVDDSATTSDKGFNVFNNKDDKKLLEIDSDLIKKVDRTINLILQMDIDVIKGKKKKNPLIAKEIGTTEIEKANLVIEDVQLYEDENKVQYSKSVEEISITKDIASENEPKLNRNKDDIPKMYDAPVIIPKYTPVRELLGKFELKRNSNNDDIKVTKSKLADIPAFKTKHEITSKFEPKHEEVKTTNYESTYKNELKSTKNKVCEISIEEKIKKNSVSSQIEPKIDTHKVDIERDEVFDGNIEIIEIKDNINGKDYDYNDRKNNPEAIVSSNGDYSKINNDLNNIKADFNKKNYIFDPKNDDFNKNNDNFDIKHDKCRIEGIKMREKRDFRARSVAEIDLGDAVVGKVSKIIHRMKSLDRVEVGKKEIINIKELPRRLSVMEKIALFEKKTSTPVKTYNTFSSLPTLKTPAETSEEDIQDKINELLSAKKYGRVEVPAVELANGVKMPVLALGTALLDPRLTKYIIRAAIDLGYRAIDTAYIYGNEREVGEAIREKIHDGTVKREELFIISKLWSTAHRTELVEAACRASLDALGLDYVDLYLIHNPMSFKEGSNPVPKIANVLQYSTSDYIDAWFGMEGVLKRGLARAVGVSNFNSAQIQRVVDRGSVKPVVNQVECHPYLSQQRLHEFCEDRNVTLSCYGVLGSKGTPAPLRGPAPPAIEDPLVQVMASGLGASASQLLIKYQLDSGRTAVVKASSVAHLWDNLQCFKLNLTSMEIDALNALNKNRRTFTFIGMGDTHRNYPFKLAF